MSADRPTPVSPALWDALQAIDGEVTDLPADADVAEKLAWVVDVLVRRGHMTEGQRRLLRHVRVSTGGAELSSHEDKRSIAGPDIDCASRLHLCFGRCCTFQVALAREDVEEGRLRWMIDRPYVLPRRETGYCENLGDDARCRVYDDRPATCRVYDCRNDPRVWIDFEQRIPAPLPPKIVPLERLRRRPAD